MSGTSSTPILYLGGEVPHAARIVAELEQDPAFEVLKATTVEQARDLLANRSDIQQFRGGAPGPKS